MFRLILCFILCMPCFLIAQNNTDTLGDTTVIKDKQGRIIRKEVNGSVVARYKYPAPDTIELAKLTVNIPPISNHFFTYKLEKDDTVLIHVCEKKGRKLREVDWIHGKKGNRYSEVKIKKTIFQFHDILKDSGTYRLKIHNRFSLRKKICDIKVQRIPKAEPTQYLLTYDTTYRKDTIMVVKSIDTILVPVLDKIVYLPPVRDFESLDYSIDSIALPLQLDSIGQFDSWGYWIGTTRDAKIQYQSLEKSIPAEWSKPGVSVPLGAYMLNEPVGLPNDKNQFVFFDFGSPAKIKGYLNENPVGKSLENSQEIYFRRNIPGFSGSKPLKVLLFLLNNNQVNGYSVRAIVIAKKLRKNMTTKIIEVPVITEKTKEIKPKA